MEASQPHAVTQQAPKSPPLAFQTTSNDSLWAPMKHRSKIASVTSPSDTPIFDAHSTGSWGIEMEMQAQLDKQTEALRLQHQAFSAERDSWQLEKDRLYRRIAALESLLKGTATGHSPARSPLVSPHSGNNFTPPHLRNATSLCSSRLASIAEIETLNASVENRRPSPLLKRGSAPNHIDLSSISITVPLDADLTTIIPTKPALINELHRSPPQTRATLTPPPPANIHHAGHTPLRASISGDMSPALGLGALDTPTRSNTARNESLADSAEEDRPLKGPLMMPELPNQPGQENFTMHMLEAKLQDLVEHPEDSEPMVLKLPTPAQEDGPGDEPITALDKGTDHVQNLAAEQNNRDDKDDKPATQPVSSDARVTPPSVAPEVDNLDVGIKLRKKPSCNFGAPLGQMHTTWKH
ncbi:hypothetical protein BDV97DRAFT_402339 [Delphinella strobiligena]|nr:hypothetical protein BDV97DRAFT_402339 [Delphinella strobiligena]